MHTKPDVVLFHHPCSAGAAAAWAIWKRWPDVKLIPANYGMNVDEGFTEPLRDKNVLVVDFSFSLEATYYLAEVVKTLTILDHHKTAESVLREFAVDELMSPDVLADPKLGRQPVAGLPVQAMFDMERSGARMAWEYAHPGTTAPPLIRYVEDRDLWRFHLPASQEINAWLSSYPLDVRSYEGAHVSLINDREGWIARAGSTVLRYRQNLIREMLEHTTRTMIIGGHEVQVANVYKPFASDAAGILAEEGVFGATYFDRADGRREFSLRSRGDDAIDVSEIARLYGGGGHHRASGFVAEAGWEGDKATPEPSGGERSDDDLGVGTA